MGLNHNLRKAKLKISAILGVKDLGAITQYLGINCIHDINVGKFSPSQSDYVDQLLGDYGMQNAFVVSNPVIESDKDKWVALNPPLLDEKNKKRYQAFVGSLLYLMHATRPDIAFVVMRLS